MTEIKVHTNDLPDDLYFQGSLAVDCEMMGLKPERDRLCLIQLTSGDGICHLVHFPPLSTYKAPNIKRVLQDPNLLKIFHFGRTDLNFIKRYLDVECGPVFCTKIASKLIRTYTDRHGLKDVCRDLLGIDLSKQEQMSDWGKIKLTPEQISYAAQDVLHLHRLKDKLEEMLNREGRMALAQACFDFLKIRVILDSQQWAYEDIFSH